MTAIHRFVDQARRGEHPRVIARMPSGWAVLGGSQLLPGYALLCPDPVVGSLNELGEPERAVFLRDMARIGDAVLAVCRPLRLNYAMLGNLEPALHAHIIPRYESEPIEMRTKPIWNYPPETWDAPAHAFNAAQHGGLLRSLNAALGEHRP
ncbi:MAG: hypothetical protein JNK58_11500 [Phycisphaerae bacterium]|nr:hypothetical protein [Phycisphaerae bacterium]